MSFTWDINPEIFRLGPLAVRYYGLLFVGVFLGGFYFLRWQMMRVGWKEEDVSDFIIPGMLAVILGARLGHVFFYEPGYYLSHPAQIIQFWKGGLASHGATLGLIVAIIYYAMRKKISIAEVADRFSFSAALGATLVRLGNFFNSEIVGRVTGGSWGVRFPRSHEDRALAFANQEVPLRHPSQLYEALMGAAIILVLYLTDKALGEKRPRGLLGAMFLSLYFTARFIVEFFKEYQTGLKEHHLLTMGQVLSIPLALAGYIWLFIAIKQNKPAQSRVPYSEEKATVSKSKPGSGKNSGKRKKRK
ncbi:MAG: prolipoprotein diacylglyceryl transferase [Deltaproteobacteria bacterium]|nr:prolipoprotein diacylglyceryl transferase [Deltaproteobacteria bacterium]